MVGGDSGSSRESFFGDHTNHYDSSGRKVGESRESFFGGHTVHYDAAGNKIGETRESFLGNHQNHFDSSGTKFGETRESLFGDHVNHYDASGNKIGESRESFFGNQINHSGISHPGAFGSARDGGIGTSPDMLAAGTGGYSSEQGFDRYVTRFGLLLGNLGIYICGAVALTVAMLILLIVLGLFQDAAGVQNLLSSITTPDGAVGISLPFGWVFVAPVAIVLNQIFFCRNRGNDYNGGILGAFIGASLFIVLGALGLLDWMNGWAGVVVSAGATAGCVVGGLMDRRAERSS